jgi:alpha-glucosidase
MLFGERRRETSWAHQIATAALFTAPLLVYGAHPQAILDNPAVELIKSIPSVWDETRVLSFSEIGEVAGFARRHGKQWFLVIANGPVARSLEVPLSFLGGGSHSALLVRDREDDPAAVVVENTTVRRDDSLKVDLRGGGGFIARF